MLLTEKPKITAISKNTHMTGKEKALANSPRGVATAGSTGSS